jgi:hypothetical protein
LFFVALIVIANHCFSLVYSQCPKGSKDLGEKCDGDEDCCNRDDPSDASLVCHHNGLFDKECTQFTCEVGTQKIAKLQSKIVAVGAALFSEGTYTLWSISGNNCGGTGSRRKCIQSHVIFGSTNYPNNVNCVFTALVSGQATLTYVGIEDGGDGCKFDGL